MEIRDRRGGFFWLNNELIDEHAANIGASALLVYMVLCRYANNDTAQARPSQETLASICQLSERSIRRSITVLEDNKLIETQRLTVKGRWDQNVYVLLAVPTSRPDKNVRSTGQATGQATGHHSRTNKTEQEVLSVCEAPRRSQSAEEEIYSLYPRKVAKKDALAAIRRALQRLAGTERPKGVTDILPWLRDCVISFAESPKGKSGEYTPYPATWFNGSRYLDDQKEWFGTEGGKKGSGNGTAKQSANTSRFDRNIENARAAMRQLHPDLCDDDGADAQDGSDYAGAGDVGPIIATVPATAGPEILPPVSQARTLFPETSRNHQHRRIVRARESRPTG